MLWSRLQDVGGITLNEAEPVPSEHFIREVWQQASRECRIDCSLALTPEEVASGNRARCSRIAAPLPSDGQKIGVVFAESSSLPGFDMQDAEVLEMLAHTAASAIKIMQIEKDYQLSATFFSSMVERLSQSVLCKDVDGHFTYVNERFAEKLGKSPSEIIGKTDHDIYDNKELADKYRNDDLKVIRTGLTMDMEEPNQPPGQERSDVRVIKSPIRNAAGKVIGVQGIFWDITERKRREREIAYMLANVPDNIYFKDRQSRFTRINKHLAQQFGLQNPDEAIGKTDFDFFTEEHARPAFEDEQKIIRTGESVVGKQEKETYKDGGLRYVLTTKLPLFDYQNHIIGTFGISKDIDQLVRTDEELKDALQKKGQLLQEAHHRIKGNLETISSLLFLEAERLNDETAKRALAESRGRVQTIAIIHRMLSRSASDSALVNCNYLSELVQMLMRAHQPIANNIKQDCEIQNIQLSFDAAVNCGLVVNELVSNSLRHAFPDRRPGAIRVCLQLGQDNAVFLVVADDGIGLPAQIDPATTNSLGLELVYRWATKGLGGTLEVNRQNGTIFKIRFPQSKQRSNQPAK
jgi:PAS domain S-box-containing protein